MRPDGLGRSLTAAIAIALTLGFTATSPAGLLAGEGPGGDAGSPRVFHGGSGSFNRLCFGSPNCEAEPLFATSALRVLGILVDTADLRYQGTGAQLEAYRLDRIAAYEANVDGYWREASYGQVGVELEISPDLVELDGDFLDYYNRDFVPASLTTSGLSFPLEIDGSQSATIHVRDSSSDVDVELDPSPGTYATATELADEIQAIFDAVPGVPSSWIECAAGGGEVQIRLVDARVDEGSFIRVRSGAGLDELGLDGPLESPPDGPDRAMLVGKPVPGGFPVTLSGSEIVEMEMRDGQEYPVTRRVTVALPAGSFSRDEIVTLLRDELNAAVPTSWVSDLDQGAGRIALELTGAVPGDDAAIRVVGGSGLATLGLDGPVRIDGVIHDDKEKTVRGYRPGIVTEALEGYMAQRAAEEGIDLTCGNDEAEMTSLANSELAAYDSILVLFVHDLDGDGAIDVPTGRRAGASSSGTYQLRIPDTTVACVGYAWEYEFSAGFMIGTGESSWKTWAHELGHNLGFEDLYSKSWHDDALNHPMDYVEDWGLMDSSSRDPHVCSWHKLEKQGWIPAGAIEDIDPPNGQVDTHTFTLVPLEYPYSDYQATGTGNRPARQVLRLLLSDEHWILVENRQPGDDFSQSLPNDADGATDTLPAGAERGGLLVTDVCAEGAFCGNRPRVVVLNPAGTTGVSRENARGIAAGETWDLVQATPAGYDGIVIRDLGAISGPAGQPEARHVEVSWGPGEFVELEIRPWGAPPYESPDIWVDWPGDGEDVDPDQPPSGNGEPALPGSVNLLKVRVSNHGTVDATGVEVEMSVNTPGGMGAAGDFVPLPDTILHDIPAGGHADYAFEWTPDTGEHTCVRARIVSHDSPLADVDSGNNEAQENIWTFSTGSASPYDPIEFDIKVTSEFDFPADVMLTPTGLPRGMDFELERNQLHMRPHETAIVPARILVDVDVIPPPGTSSAKFRQFEVHALLETFDSYVPFGGASIRVLPAWKSTIRLDGVRCDPAAALALLFLGGPPPAAGSGCQDYPECPPSPACR